MLARAVAALNHPNIVAIFDVGDRYFVTGLVEGQPLRGGGGDTAGMPASWRT